jgi:hypothetical protein
MDNFYLLYYIQQFLNTAMSDNVMAVNHSIVSGAGDVESFKCTASPWNPFGRSVIFVEIPAFNHSDTMMQKKIPDFISRWLNRNRYVLHIHP